MINQEIFKMADKLQSLVQQQMAEARKGLADMPEGEVKDKLKGMLNRASNGELTPEQAKSEIEQLLKNGHPH